MSQILVSNQDALWDSVMKCYCVTVIDQMEKFSFGLFIRLFVFNPRVLGSILGLAGLRKLIEAGIVLCEFGCWLGSTMLLSMSCKGCDNMCKILSQKQPIVLAQQAENTVGRSGFFFFFFFFFLRFLFIWCWNIHYCFLKSSWMYKSIYNDTISQPLFWSYLLPFYEILNFRGALLLIA